MRPRGPCSGGAARVFDCPATSSRAIWPRSRIRDCLAAALFGLASPSHLPLSYHAPRCHAPRSANAHADAAHGPDDRGPLAGMPARLPCSSCRCLTRLHLCGREKKKTLVMIQTRMTWSKTIPCRKLLCRLEASRQQPCRWSPEGPVKPLSRPPQPGSPRPRTSSTKPRLR